MNVNRGVQWLYWTCLGVVLVIVHGKLWIYAYDDAYIHFRIANHLATVGTPYFNPGEAVMASSSSVWTICLFFLVKLIGVQPLVVAVINALLTLAGAFVWTTLVKYTTPARIPVFLILLVPLCYVGMMLHASIGLMETPVSLFVLGGTLLLWMAKDEYSRYSWVLFGALPFLRLELTVFVVLFALYSLGVRKIGLTTLLVYLAIGAAPLILYELYFFRTLLPHTIVAKSVADILLPGQTLAFILYYLTSNTFPNPLSEIYPLIYVVVGTALLMLALWRIRTYIHTKKIGFYLLGAGGLIIIAAYLSQSVLVFPWYAPLFLVPLLIGAFAVSVKLRTLGVVAFTVLTIPGLNSLGSALYSSLTNGANYQEFVENARVRKYIEVGQALYRQYPNATLMTPEIGGLGYGFPGYISDGAGLVSPGALKYLQMLVPEYLSSGKTGGIPLGFIQEVNPDLIVGYDSFVEAFMKSDLIREYIWLREPIYIDSDMQIKQNDSFWSNRNLNIFVRKDLVSQPSVRGFPLSSSELDTFAVRLLGPSATVVN